MPRRDGTGPMGVGTMTGRGFGICADGNGKGLGFKNRGSYGCKRGFGGGFANNNATEPAAEELLVEQKNFLEKKLEFINKQLEKNKS